MGTESNKDERNTPEYLAQLLKDKKQMQAFPNVFLHIERLLDDEVNRVRGNLFHLNSSTEHVMLPEPIGPVVTIQEKLFVPVKDHPDFNFVGRILGPRGMTAKQLEQDTGCKIMVRGMGSMRDKKKEEMNRGKPNWEHLNEDLHVLITVEDTRSRAELKLRRAVDEVKKLLIPAPEGEDDLKKRQLMELAIINGTYRDTKALGPGGVPGGLPPAQGPRFFAPGMALGHMLRSPTPAGAPIILTPRMQPPMSPVTSMAGAALYNGMPPPLVSPSEAGLIYPFDPYGMIAPMLEYPAALDQSIAGAVPKLRRAVSMREHPYNRLSLANL